MTNCGLILLISSSKILEMVMFNRLNNHLQSNKTLVPEQFGFRKESNTEKAIITLTIFLPH
jgi:hypothetical protein